MLNLISKKRVHSDGRHNAFTDIVFFKDKYYLVFRNGTHHVSADGKIMIMTSEDGENWSKPTLLPILKMDMRDPKLLVYQEKLWCLFPAAWVAEGKARRSIFSAVCVSDDGQNWSNPWPISVEGSVVWRPKLYKGRLYVAFMTKGFLEVDLMASDDGFLWREVSPIYKGQSADETDIHFFEDGGLMAVIRREEQNSIIAFSQPPYLQWRYDEMDIQLHCPCLQQVGGRLLLAGRDYKRCNPVYDSWKYWTQDRVVVLEWDGKKFCNSLELDFRDGGDSGYQGIQPVPNKKGEALVSYYKGVGEKVGYQADIYVARIGVQ